MSERFLAEATVVVRADTTQARKAILDLNKVKVKTVSVPVKPNMSGFVGALRKGVLDAQKNVVARVRVEPNMAGFRAKLQTEVAAAAEKVKAQVSVTPAVTRGAAAAAPAAARTQTAAAAATATGGVVDRRLVTAQQAVNTAVDAGVAARRRDNSELTQAEKLAAKLARQQIALKAATDSVTKAVLSGDAALVQQAQSLERVAKAAIEATTAQQARAAERAARPGLVREERIGSIQESARAELSRAETIVAAQKTAAEAEEKSVRTREKLNIELTENAFKQSQLRIKNLEAEVAAQIAADKARTRARVETRITAIEQDPAFVTGQQIRNRLESESAAIERALVNARRRLSVVDLEGAGATNAVSAARQRANAAETVTARLATLVARAREAGVASLIQETEALHAKAAAELRNQRETLRSAEAEATAAKTQAFRARGFGAQLATFAGLRGAVLAANAQFIAGTVAAIAFGKAVQSIAQLESELNVFKVTTGATAAEMVRVADAARKLGTDVSLPAVTAGSAAEAMTELAKAGLSVEDSISGARGVLQLATAAQIDNATATQIAASALNAFGLAGTEAVHVADVLTNAANASQGSIQDMGIAFQQASAVARQVGISFEDTVAFLTLLSRAGIQGSDAGTSLRVAFTRLINPTDKAQKVLDELGVRIRDIQGNIRPQVFTDFAAAQANLTKKQQDANAAIVFGTDALRAYSIISRAGVGGFAEVSAALDKQGSAAELANARMAGLTGSAENLKNQLSGLGLTVGAIVRGPLKSLADNLATIISLLNSTAGGAVKAGVSLKSTFDKISKEVNDFATVNIKGFEIGPKTFFDPANPLKAATEGLKRVQDVTSDTSGEIFRARGEVVGLIDNLNKIGGLTNINKTVVDLQKLQAKLAGGDEQSQKFAEDIGVFIKQLQKVSANPKIDPFQLSIEIPPELLSGDPGRVAAQASIAKFRSTLAASQTGNAKAFFDAMFGGFAEGLGLFVPPLARQAAEAGATVKEAFLRASRVTQAEANAITNQLADTTSAALDIAISGGTPLQQARARLANAKKAEAEARRLVDVRARRVQDVLLKGGTKAQLAARKKDLDAAKQLVADAIRDQQSAQAEITSIQQKAASDAKSKRDDAQKARDAADQAILDSFAPVQNRLDIIGIRASHTETLKDDLAVQIAIARQARREIAIIDKMIKDRKTRNSEIAARVKIIAAANAEAETLRKQIADQARENARKARDLITETLGKKLQLAELKGGRDAILAAYNKAIADARRRVKNAKKLGLVLIDEQIALQTLINDRKDFLNQLDGDVKKGLTAFDLLKQNVETFNAVGGNLIQGNQPFAGPTGFTADVAQWLVALKKPTPAALTPTTPTKGKIEINDDRIVRSLDHLADTIERTSGNTTAGTPGVTVVGQRWSGGAFWEARRTNNWLNANNG